MLRDCHLALNPNPAAWPMGQVINRKLAATKMFCPIIDPTTIQKLLVESCLNPCKASTSVSESIWFASILLIDTLIEPIAQPNCKTAEAEKHGERIHAKDDRASGER